MSVCGSACPAAKPALEIHLKYSKLQHIEELINTNMLLNYIFSNKKLMVLEMKTTQQLHIEQ